MFFNYYYFKQLWINFGFIKDYLFHHNLMVITLQIVDVGVCAYHIEPL